MEKSASIYKKSTAVKILGIDPGLANCGWGVVEVTGGQYKLVEYGCVVTKGGEARLKNIYSKLQEIAENYRIERVALEKLFLFKNSKSVMEVAQVIGLIKLVAESRGLEVVELTPLQVKMGLAGYGRAEKGQVERMVRSLLKIEARISPSHASDAVAIALVGGMRQKW